jgi:hypothetical protein
MFRRPIVDLPFYHDSHTSSQSKWAGVLLGLIILLGLGLRLWGLGGAGLHGDEETTAMPALAVLNSGLPLMPSGMLYPRAIPHSYLVALSVLVFGVSEWAIRLPSALAGTLLIYLAYLLGKRFLPIKLNLVLALVICISPWMIQMSQTARMYILFSAAAVGFAVLVLRWGETEKWQTLAAAFGAYLIALSFHTLAVFSSLLFVFPLLKKTTLSLFLKFGAAFLSAIIVFSLQKNFEAFQYRVARDLPSAKIEGGASPLDFLVGNHQVLFVLLFAIFLLGLVVITFVKKPKNAEFHIGIVCLAVAVALECLMQYHAAAVLALVGLIIFLRSNEKKSALAFCALFLCLIPVLQFYLLTESAHDFSVREILKTSFGSFSISPFIAFFGKFPLCLGLYLLSLLTALYHLGKGNRVPDHFLLFIVAVWLPLFLEGALKWYVFSRYTFQFLPFFVLCSLAGVLYLRGKYLKGRRFCERVLFAALVVSLIWGFVPPSELRQALSHDLSRFPDHRGAAQFVKAAKLEPEDTIIVEDPLQMTFYLGNVDYWLRSFEDAKHFVKRKEGALVDIYTNTPLIGFGRELELVLKGNPRGSVYLITSGETADSKDYYLGKGIREVIEANHPMTLFSGADGKTKVLVFP